MRTHKADTAGITIAVGLFVLAGVIAWDVTGLGGGMAYGIGPQAMPLVVAAGLAILAAGNLLIALRGELPERESADPRAVLLILGGFVALIALIAFGGGFIIATAILFATTAAKISIPSRSSCDLPFFCRTGFGFFRAFLPAGQNWSDHSQPTHFVANRYPGAAVFRSLW